MLPIPEFGIGENGRDPKIRNPGIAISMLEDEPGEP